MVIEYAYDERARVMGQQNCWKTLIGVHEMHIKYMLAAKEELQWSFVVVIGLWGILGAYKYM